MPSGVAYFVIILLISVSFKDPYDLLVHNVVAVCESSTDVIVEMACFFKVQMIAFSAAVMLGDMVRRVLRNCGLYGMDG